MIMAYYLWLTYFYPLETPKEISSRRHHVEIFSSWLWEKIIEESFLDSAGWTHYYSLHCFFLECGSLNHSTLRGKVISLSQNKKYSVPFCMMFRKYLTLCFAPSSVSIDDCWVNSTFRYWSGGWWWSLVFRMPWQVVAGLYESIFLHVDSRVSLKPLVKPLYQIST